MCKVAASIVFFIIFIMNIDNAIPDSIENIEAAATEVVKRWVEGQISGNKNLELLQVVRALKSQMPDAGFELREVEELAKKGKFTRAEFINRVSFFKLNDEGHYFIQLRLMLHAYQASYLGIILDGNKITLPQLADGAGGFSPIFAASKTALNIKNGLPHLTFFARSTGYDSCAGIQHTYLYNNAQLTLVETFEVLPNKKMQGDCNERPRSILFK